MRGRESVLLRPGRFVSKSNTIGGNTELWHDKHRLLRMFFKIFSTLEGKFLRQPP